MRAVLAVLAFVSATLASDVLELTDSDFASKIAGLDLILVEFFAPWCGHCKRLAPEYERAATSLKDNDPPVPLAKVDCTANEEVCKKYGVSGYPTLKIFRAGEFSEEYGGPREADGIIKYMQTRAGPTSKELTDVATAEKFLSKGEYGVIGFFEDGESDLAKTFQKTADAMSTDLRFAHTTSKEVLDKYGYKNDIVLFQPKRLNNKFEESVMKYTDDAAVHKIKDWINSNLLGLCGHRTQGNAEKFKKPLVVAYYDVDYVKNEKGTNYWRNRVMKVGKKLKDEGKKVYFAVSNHKDFSYELGEFGMGDVSGDKPVVAARDESDKKYVMTEEFSMDNLEKFVRDFLDGKVEPYLKSEAVPDNTGAAVKTVVAKNFDEIVNDPERDVLIEFYAPWCGHCKQLEPKYNELGEKLAEEPGITIAKMDATANDVAKPYEVSGFPTIYFAPKGSKDSPRKYSGGREVDDFLKYLAKESTDELNGYKRDGKKKKKKTEL
ncbi:protein disulfide-isomerase A3-like [Saccostrea cucullata]|uniref:protein disulfide-isomerase A3-like n=1 Tax=Saccostrea cuccullata TaxID=36930 RepID=UPI002ED57715